MVARAGHSLVELIVAVTVLGVALSGVAATSALSVGLVRDALRLEEDAARAAFLLDSLTIDGAPSSGAATFGRTRYRWTVTPSPEGWPRLVVSATDSLTGALVVELTGAAPAPPPRAGTP